MDLKGLKDMKFENGLTALILQLFVAILVALTNIEDKLKVTSLS